MPYIKTEDRTAFDGPDVRYRIPTNPGTLNYQFTLDIIRYVRAHGLNYQIINNVIGALESTKAEFQRRVVAPYEDTKIEENGDVYPPDLTGSRHEPNR